MRNRSGVIIFRIVALITVALSLFLFSFHLYLKKNSSVIFKSYMDKFLNNSGSIYRTEHNSIDIDFLGGQIVLKNLKISFDENKLKDSTIKKKMLLKASIPLLLIKGISISDLIFSRRIKAERIFLKKGKFKLYIFREKVEEKEVITGPVKLPAISFGGIVIEDTDIEFFTEISSTPKSGLRGINLDTGKVEFDPEKTPVENFGRKSPTIQLYIRDSFIVFKNSGYKAETGFIRYGSAGSSISVKNFKYAPATREVQKEVLAKRGKFHRITIPEMNLKNIDIKELSETERLRAGQLYLNNPDIYIFRNRNVKGKIKNNTKKLPQQILREAGLKVDLKLIRIKKGYIKYSEIAIGEKRSESLIFTELASSFYDVSNFHEIQKTGKESEISVSTRVMGNSLLKGKIMIPVNNRADRFSFSGSLSGTNLFVFNKYLKRNVRIRIDKGKLNYMTFSVQADKNRASGSMKLSYSNLHVTLLRKKNSARKSRFGTFLANTLTHKSNPTKRGKDLRVGKILFERKVKRSIFNYMWKCLLAGIKSSIIL